MGERVHSAVMSNELAKQVSMMVSKKEEKKAPCKINSAFSYCRSCSFNPIETHGKFLQGV